MELNCNNNFVNVWERNRKSIFGSKDTCLCPYCNQKAIFSHVLQQAHILNNLCNKDKEIRIFEFSPLYYNNGFPQYKLKAISKRFGFYGFCQQHDSTIFHPIENNVTEGTWAKKESQYLLSYRTVLRHESQSAKARLVYEKILAEFPNLNRNRQIELLDKDLQLSKLYRNIIEEGITNKDFSKLDFFYHILPYRIEIANASCIYFTKPIYYGPPEKQEFYICIFFPFNDKTFIIIGYIHKNQTCWLDELKPLFKSNVIEDNYIAINNILLGSGLHCMKPSYYDALSKEKIDKFIKDWRIHNNVV